ncbi:MAG: hypothetical protein AAF936_13180 [Pseudomonadota bacterium]
MTAQAKQGQKQRIAHLAAIVALALAHCFTAAHAENDHHGDASASYCAICCLVPSDDDIDASSAIDDLVQTWNLQSRFRLPSVRVLSGKADSYSVARGPPLN